MPSCKQPEVEVKAEEVVVALLVEEEEEEKGSMMKGRQKKQVSASNFNVETIKLKYVLFLQHIKSVLLVSQFLAHFSGTKTCG
jgi:hypothetical protein